MTQRRVVWMVLVVLVGCGWGASAAAAEPTHVEQALKALSERVKIEPKLEHLSETGSVVRNEVDRGLSDVQWLDELYNSPSAPAVKELGAGLDPEDAAQVKTYVEKLKTGTESISLSSSEESELGSDVLETAGDARIESAATVSALTNAAANGDLLYEDITTGSNPAYNVLVGTYAPESPELHFPGEPEAPAAYRMHDVGTINNYYEELYGENAEELGLCKGEGACLQYVYPWEFKAGREYCGENAPYTCGDEQNFFGGPAKFVEGQYEVEEADFGGEWYVTGELWFVYGEFEELEYSGSGKYRTLWERQPELSEEITATHEPECLAGVAYDRRDWPQSSNPISEVEPVLAPFAAEPGEGNACRYWTERVNPERHEKGDTVWTWRSRDPVTGNRWRTRTYLHLPNHDPEKHPVGLQKTSVSEPKILEQTEGLAKRGGVKKHTEELIAHLTEEGPEVGSNQLEEKEGEEFGPNSPGEPERKNCLISKPVNCATGNETQTQTDLSVGGRGPGLQQTLTYNSLLAVKQVAAGPFGFGWTGSYSAHLELKEGGKKATVYQSNGSTITFTHSGEAWTAPSSLVQATLAVEGSGYVYTLPNQTKLDFNIEGRLTKETDRNGNAITLAYNAEKQLETATDGAGRKLTFKYNGSGEVESVKDPMGHTVKYTYESGNLATVTLLSEEKPRWKYKYNSEDEMVSATDGREHATTIEYNEARQVSSQTDAMSRKRTWKYATTKTGTETTITEPNGATTVEQFNEYGSPTSVTHASGKSYAATTTYEYNVADELIAAVDPNKHKTEYGYDSAGNKTSEKDPNGNERKWKYNATHDVETTTTPKGETTTIKRDSHGNPEVIERPAPGGKTQKTTYKYDSHGDLTSETDSLERTRSFEYDTAGDRITETNPAGKRTWEYNEDSQEISTVTPRGNVTGGEPAKFTTKIERDAQGRPLKVTDPLAFTTKYTYDGDGNLETLTDGNSHKTTYSYDADNEPIKVEQPSKAITETEYDSLGQVASQTDANKHTTKYVRNLLEEVTEVVDPLAHKTTKEYDPAGNLIKLTDPAKRTTTYTYDPANRLKEIVYSSGKPATVKYEYDKDGDRAGISDGTGATTYTFDQLDRLTESKDGHGDIAKYEYDLDNEQTKITYPNGKAVTRTYDNAGRPQSLTDWLEHTTKFSYDADSDLATITFPASTGDVDKYEHNQDDQMSSQTMVKGTETLASLAYAHDGDDQVTSGTVKGLPGEEKPSYEYDTNNRLTKGVGITYEYDAANNATKIGAGAYKYNAGSELETGPSLTYTYDELGERTKTKPAVGPAITYGYDQAGELTSVERPKEGETAEIKDTYAYDGNGLRASQTIAGTTTYMVWDMAEGLPLLLSDTTNSYIYGPGGLPFEQISSGGTVTYLHHDQQGSTRLLTGSTGTVTGSTTFDAYGNKTGSTGTSTTPLGYDGQYTSTDTGLIYLRARVYDPATAQFLTVDPMVGNTRAPYNYAEDNPINYADLSGLNVFEEAGEAVAGWGDKLSLGLTKDAREALGDENVNTCSSAYQAGGYAGLATAAVIPGEGEEELGAEGLNGSFSTFTRDESGAVNKYTTYGPADPRDPEDFRPTSRYDGTGKGHFNKVTGERVATPHVHDPNTPGGVRPPNPEEIP